MRARETAQPLAIKIPLPDPCQMALAWSIQQQAVQVTPAPLGWADTGTAPVATAAGREARARGIPTGTQPRFRLGAALSHSNTQGLVQFLLPKQDQSYPSHP